jgi:DNA-binding LacI/PurR family transcriptional regulator
MRELADMFGVSRMTVWRVVQNAPFSPEMLRA